MSVVRLAPAEAPEKFACGDVVQLKSGGHCMTVRTAAARKIVADWLTDTGELTTADFAPAMLMLAPPEQQGDEEPPAP